MKAEQMELMKVIEFPKQKIEEKWSRERLDKLEVAYKMLKYLIEEGAEFHITVDTEKASELFELTKGQLESYKYTCITSNYPVAKEMNLNKAMFYEIKGDEF